MDSWQAREIPIVGRDASKPKGQNEIPQAQKLKVNNSENVYLIFYQPTI